MTQEVPSQGQRQFVTVPVPVEYVMPVMKYIAELDAPTEPPTVATRPGGETTTGAADASHTLEIELADWTVENLRDLATGRNFTTRLLTRVMDALVSEPDTWRTSAQLAERLGIERTSLKGIWTHVGRHLGNRYPGLRWPLEGVWGPDIDPDFTQAVYYRLTSDQAARWAQARDLNI